jgi:hypothetical protein
MHYRVASFSYSYSQLKNDMTAKLQTKRDASMKKTSFLDYFEPNYVDVVSPSLERCSSLIGDVARGNGDGLMMDEDDVCVEVDALRGKTCFRKRPRFDLPAPTRPNHPLHT